MRNFGALSLIFSLIMLQAGSCNSNDKSYVGKTLTIIGGNGYVGRNIAKKAAALGINVYSISPEGPNKYSHVHDNIKHLKGDALYPEKYKAVQ